MISKWLLGNFTWSKEF